MHRLILNKARSILIMLMLMSVSFPVFASGDIILVYYVAGAALVQIALLTVILIFWRGSRALTASIYVSVVVAAWYVAMSMRTDFYPLVTAMAVAVLPFAICLSVRKITLIRNGYK